MYDFCCPIFVSLGRSQPGCYALEDMTERPVPDIVQKCGQQRFSSSVGIVLLAVLASNDINNEPSEVIDPYAMRESAVGRTGIDEI